MAYFIGSLSALTDTVASFSGRYERKEEQPGTLLPAHSQKVGDIKILSVYCRILTTTHSYNMYTVC